MEIEEIKLIDLPIVHDPRGNLSFIQGPHTVPFEIERCYWIYDVPGGKDRYGRALKTTYEAIIALSGSFDVRLNNGSNENVVHLSRGYKCLLVPPMHWREITNFSTNSVALVLASSLFDENDYIRDFNIFSQLTNK